MSPIQVQKVAEWSLQEAIDDLFEAAVGQTNQIHYSTASIEKQQESFLDQGMFEANMQGNSEEQLQSSRNDWIWQMTQPGHDLLQKMVYFWHCHFACVCPTAELADSYRQTLTEHALGNYRSMVLAVAKEPAMIRFLNNQQNRKQHANENFARELMEIFTLGEGNFTEGDVKSAARAFTGWSSDQEGRFVFRPPIHDRSLKLFRGRRGNFGGEDIIHMILDDRLAATHLARRIFAFFVNDVPDHQFILSISRVLYESDYDLNRTMRFVFEHPSFYDSRHKKAKIKSPIELIVHLMKLLELSFEEAEALTFLQKTLGQILFFPPNVAGWTGGRSWINNATLMLRLNLATYLVNEGGFDHSPTASLKASGPSAVIQTIKLKQNLEPLISLFAGLTFEQLSAQIKQVLLAGMCPQELTTAGDKQTYDYIKQLVLRAMQLPDFQLC